MEKHTFRRNFDTCNHLWLTKCNVAKCNDGQLQLSRLTCCAKFSSWRDGYARGFKQDSGKRVSLFIVLREFRSTKGPDTEAIFSVVCSSDILEYHTIIKRL